MLVTKGVSLSRGVILGKPWTITGDAQSAPQSISNAVIAVFTHTPSAGDFFQAVKTVGAAAAIVPSTSPYSHLAWAASYLDVSTIVVPECAQLENASTMCIDFDDGRLLLPTSPEDEKLLEAYVARALEWKLEADRHARDAAITKSGSELEFLAQLHSSEDVEIAKRNGACGVGEIKSELLTDMDGHVTSTLSQLVFEIMSRTTWRPVPIRFFDFSADKLSKYSKRSLGQDQAAYRGVRILEIDHRFMEDYAQAISTFRSSSIVTVLPMVTDVSEVITIVSSYQAMLGRVGVTIETPAAALMAHEFFEITDYVEVGLNDLTQFTMASDRNSPSTQRLPSDHLATPVAHLIESVIGAGAKRGVKVPIVLDLRPTVGLVRQLVNIGAQVLTVSPRLIPYWKQVVRETE